MSWRRTALHRKDDKENHYDTNHHDDYKHAVSIDSHA